MQSFVCNDSLNYQVKDQVAYVTLNRPDKGNALNEKMITELTQIFNTISQDPLVRVLCLSAQGKNFCTGADLQDMRASVDYSLTKNTDEAKKLAHLMQTMHDLDVPVIAAVQGAVYGGAMGLIANCDIVIAEEHASFCLSEVKLGLVPAVISPYVIEALGLRLAKYLMLTAEKITAAQALDMGLVHQVVAMPALISTLQACIDNLLQNGPQALRHVKKLCRELPQMKTISDRQNMTANLIARVRISPEAQVRMRDFFEKKND